MKLQFYPQLKGDLVFVAGSTRLHPLIVTQPCSAARGPSPDYVTCWAVDALGYAALTYPLGIAGVKEDYDREDGYAGYSTLTYPLWALRRGVWSFVGPVCVEDAGTTPTRRDGRRLEKMTFPLVGL